MTPEERLREALRIALSVRLHEELDPACEGSPPYGVTVEQADRIAEATMRARVVRDALHEAGEWAELGRAWQEAESAADAIRAGSIRGASRPQSPLTVHRWFERQYTAKAEGVTASGPTPTAALRAYSERTRELSPT